MQSTRLPRARLVQRVLGTPEGGLCLVRSEAGYGRRTLLSSALGETAAVVALDPAPIGAAELRALLVDALEACTAPWLVVTGLDPAVHEDAARTLSELVRRCPPGRRLAAVSTSEPLGAFSHGLVEDLLVDLDQDDLALSREEALVLLEASLPDLSAQVRQELADLCDGWLLALVAAARMHRERPDRDVLAWLRTHGAERLFGGWLAAQSDDVRDMLMQTALLEQLTPDLADAVTESASGHLLPALARPHGAVRVAAVASDTAHVWFDRHPLLTTLLRYLGGGRDSQARHRRAAEWYRRNGDLGQELVHLLSAGDADAAIGRFHEIEDELMLSGGADVALRWYEQLPAPQAAEHLLRVAWAHGLAGRVTEARQTLYRLRWVLEQGTATDPSPHPALADIAAEVDVLAAWLAERVGDIVGAVAAASRAREVFGPSWSTNSHQLATLLLARGRLLLGATHEADAVLATVRDNPFTTAVLGEGRRADTEAAVAWSAGNVHQARVWASRHDRWLRAQHPASAVSRHRSSSLGGFLCLAEEGRYDEALSGATACAAAARESGAVTDHVEGVLAVAHLHRMRWRLQLAWEQTLVARSAVLESNPDGGLLPRVTAQQVRVRLMSGDHVRAERLIRSMPPSTTRQLLSARLALVRGASHAHSLVREIEPATVRVDVERAVLSAWALAPSSRQRAETELLRAADLADQYGLTTVLVDVPDLLIDIARRAAAYHVHDPLLGLVRTAVEARSAGATSPAPTPTDLVLTRGELELLALLPSRATYAGLADRLGVSINTVKTRLRRLYAKLGAHDRETAIAQAARLGLLTRAGR